MGTYVRQEPLFRGTPVYYIFAAMLGCNFLHYPHCEPLGYKLFVVVRLVDLNRKAKAVVTLLLAAMLAVSALAQSTDPAATAVVSGTVLDSVTGQPLKAVEVRARNFSPGRGASQANSATTDSEGHFTLDSIAPGRYFFSAARQGYVGQHISGGTNGRMLSVAPGQHSSDLVIELIPGANISGRIKTPDDKPLQGVSLEIVKYFPSADGKELHSVGSPVLTNAGGDYHVTGLTPGRYYIRAVAPASNSESKAPTKDAYPTTYYPNSTEVSTAAVLTVRAGQDLSGMDVTLTPVRPVTVTGKVVMAGTSAPSPGASVTLISDDASSQVEATTDAKGAFALQAIPSRNYVLVARVEPSRPDGKMLWGQRPLHIGDTNVRNANCTIGPGLPLSGRIHVDEKANVDLTKITVDLQPQGNPSVDALMPEVNSSAVRADGTFSFLAVPEGIHSIEFSSLPPGSYVKSTGSVDILESGVTIAQNRTPAPLDFTLSLNSAQLTGTVSNDQLPASGAFVALLPQGGHTSRFSFYKRSLTDQSGRFSIKGIAPGDYKVIALVGIERGSLGDPDFLQQFEDRGEPVHLQEGSTLSINLDATSADETTP
jgi:protocatechuate 3,4-dioxygenase beta subunit